MTSRSGTCGRSGRGGDLGVVSGRPSAPSQAPALPPGPSRSLRRTPRSPPLVRPFRARSTRHGGLKAVGWNNPPIPWAELEARLSGRVSPDDPLDPDWARLHQSPLGRSPGGRPALAPAPDPAAQRPRLAPTSQLDRNGDPIPPWSRSRRERRAPPTPPAQATVPYAELHSHSNFSFLDGASDPEDLIEEAVWLGLTALAITDHDGLYAVARFAEAAQGHDLATIYGAELSLGLRTPQNGVADPKGRTCWCSPVGSRATTGWPGRSPRRSCAATRRVARSTTWPSSRLPPRALDDPDRLPQGPRSARRSPPADRRPQPQELDRLTALFGHDRVVVELVDHGRPDDSTINDRLVELARVHDLPVVATNASTTPSRGSTGWPAPWPRSEPAAACRRWTAGCRCRVPICGPGRRWPGSSPATRG